MVERENHILNKKKVNTRKSTQEDVIQNPAEFMKGMIALKNEFLELIGSGPKTLLPNELEGEGCNDVKSRSMRMPYACGNHCSCLSKYRTLLPCNVIFTG